MLFVNILNVHTKFHINTMALMYLKDESWSINSKNKNENDHKLVHVNCLIHILNALHQIIGKFLINNIIIIFTFKNLQMVIILRNQGITYILFLMYHCEENIHILLFSINYIHLNLIIQADIFLLLLFNHIFDRVVLIIHEQKINFDLLK